MLKLLTLTSMILLISACGGGASQHEPREEKTLYFIDSPTNGIDYHCGERSGVTKTYTQNGIVKHGLLKCVYTPVHFSLGSLSLGSVEHVVDGQTIYPQDLVASFDGDFNNEELLKIAILLQSLDDKSSSDHITITDSTKAKIGFTTLNNLSIAQLNQAIVKMGFTPVSQEDAKAHLILNSPNIHSNRPKIEPFEEDISNELTVGSVVGELTIDQGDGELVFPFSLEGEGKEHFMVNNKGKIIVTESFTTAKDFYLTVKISNAFGYASAPLTLHLKDSGKIGKAQMGRLKNATVKLFKLNQNSKELEQLRTETTQSSGSLNLIGNFELHTELLEDHSYYVYEVSGGVDIDSDDDRKEDEEKHSNQGKLRLISKGIWIKNANQKIRITPLSEMLYSYVERDGFKDLESSLNHYAKILLQKSLDNQNEIDAKDILLFNPLKDKALLYETLLYNNSYNNIRDKIRNGNSLYKNSLFHAYVVESFQANAIEIVGSNIYTIDMLNSGEFSIYDLESKALIGKLKLPNTPVEKDTHLLYINRIDAEARVTSLSDWSYELNIANSSKPLLDGQPDIKSAIITGSFSHTTLVQGERLYLFGQEREAHIYNHDRDEADTRTIKFSNVDKNDVYYHFEFDSQLKEIESLWADSNYLYVIGENKMHIFYEENNQALLKKVYNTRAISGNILGIEKSILYLLKENILTLYNITDPENPKFIESLEVPFYYKLGIKTNGDYITTGSQILNITSLRASKIAN